MRVCFPPSCRMHSPPSPPRVAAQEAAHSRHTAGSRIMVARPALILGCPALASGARSDQISAPKSGSAAFSCDASRTRFHRGSHSSGKTSPSKPVGTHLRFISKQYNNSNENDVLRFCYRLQLFSCTVVHASAVSCGGCSPPQDNDGLRTLK